MQDVEDNTLESRPALQWKTWGGLGALWALGQILLFVFRPGYLFPPFDMIDPWYYTAFQWNWSRMISEFGSTYYGVRISWLFVGVFFHQLFEPALANIISKLIFSAGFAAGMAWFGNKLGEKPGAVLGVCLAIFSPQVITALHADYTDTTVLIYATLSVIAIFQAGRSTTPLRWIFMAGMSFTLMTIANLGALGNIGVAVAFFHLAWLDRDLKFHGQCILAYAASAALTLGVLHGAHYISGASWDLISPQWRLVSKLNNMGTDNPWYFGGWQWMVRATWLVIPVGALVWGVLRSYFSKSADEFLQKLIRALTHSLAFAWMVGLILELRGSQVIALIYYASSLLALALPLLLALVCSYGLKRAHLIRFGLSAFGLFAVVALFPDPLVYLDQAKWLRKIAGASEAVLWLGAAILAGFCVIWRFIPIKSIGKSALGGLLVVGSLFYLSVPRTYYHFSYGDRLEQRYNLLHETLQYIDQNYGNDGYRFWIDRDFSDAASLASCKLWGYRLWTFERFPEMGNADFTDRKIISPQPLGEGRRAAAQIHETFAPIGIRATNLSIKTIDAGEGIGFDLVEFDLALNQLDPEAPPEGMARPTMIAGFEYSGQHPYTNDLEIFAHMGGPARLDTSQSWPVFHRSDPIDFAYTAYRPLPPAGKNRRIGLVVYLNSPGKLTLTVEDDGRSQFLVWDIMEVGRHHIIAQLPNDATAYRLRLYSKYESKTTLPNNINVYYIPPAADD